ncbi:Glycosyl transferase family 1 [Gammaproteobacteria bacterium]
MRILCLCKRRPQQRDLLTRPYGRFFYLPKYLAEQGHEVYLLLLSYQNETAEKKDFDGIHCYSESIFPFGVKTYIQRAAMIIAEKKPDWIFGFSDTWYGILAQWLGARYAIRSLIDAYDNYESYIPWLKPLHWRWRMALRRATVVTAAGENLADYLRGFRDDQIVHVLPMSADPLFIPMDKAYCRQQLGLQRDVPLLGYCGALSSNRGIHTLFHAYSELKQEIPQLELILSGRLEKNLRLPANIHVLGYVPDQHMPLLINSLDTLGVLNLPSAFGNFSYPVKLYEAMRCNVPVVVSRTPASAEILRQHPEFLVTPGNIQQFAAKAKWALGLRRIAYTPQPDWQHNGELLVAILLKYRHH